MRLPMVYKYPYNKNDDKYYRKSRDINLDFTTNVSGDLNVSGNVRTNASFIGNVTGRSGSTAQATQLAPMGTGTIPNNAQTHVPTNNDSLGNSIFSIRSGARGYQWRLRARGNGAGAELYLEYYRTAGDWKAVQYWGAYKDAMGGTPG